ncbi:hypothetical protein [Streptomyces sp. NPDC049555]|uniref:hypothetical protein n=1 Tax=Streptomyces sp. NPDC049555 TaxID=3154930 RepID=UPI003423ADAC
MSTDDSQVLGVLAATVHVLHPAERIPLILTAGSPIADPAVAEQITNPDCWIGGQPPVDTGTEKAPKKPAKTTSS